MWRAHAAMKKVARVRRGGSGRWRSRCRRRGAAGEPGHRAAGRLGSQAARSPGSAPAAPRQGGMDGWTWQEPGAGPGGRPGRQEVGMAGPGAVHPPWHGLQAGLPCTLSPGAAGNVKSPPLQISVSWAQRPADARGAPWPPALSPSGRQEDRQGPGAPSEPHIELPIEPAGAWACGGDQEQLQEPAAGAGPAARGCG